MWSDPAAIGVQTGYANLRQVLGDRYAALPDAAIRAQMEAALGPEAAEQYEEYLEGMFDDIGRAFSSAAGNVAHFVTKAAPVVATVGGGALQGALAGSSAGLPGIIAGLAVGGAGAGLSKYGTGTARDIGGALTGVTGLASQFSPAGRLGASVGPAVSGLAGSGPAGAAGAAVNALGGLLGSASGSGGAPVAALTSLFGGGSAAGQLVSLLQRPEVLMALEKLKLGGGGAIPVGAAGTPVPAAGIAGLVRELADEAIDEAAAQYEDAESDLGYMTDAFGQFVGDPAVPRDRAAQIWNLLNNAQAERLLNAIAQFALQRRFADADQEGFDEASETFDEGSYDELDFAEFYNTQVEDPGTAEADYEWDEGRYQ